jgi:hypothetical protein
MTQKTELHGPSRPRALVYRAGTRRLVRLTDRAFVPIHDNDSDVSIASRCRYCAAAPTVCLPSRAYLVGRARTAALIHRPIYPLLHSRALGCWHAA